MAQMVQMILVHFFFWSDIGFIGSAPISVPVVYFAAFWPITSLWSWAGKWSSIPISAGFVWSFEPVVHHGGPSEPGFM